MGSDDGVMPAEILIEDAADPDAVSQLWAQYWDEHHEDLGAQDLAMEARALPKGYEAPDGALLVAKLGHDVVGTVGLQRFDEETADMRRMYVPQQYRGQGIGEALVQGIMQKAKSMGYTRMILDVSESQTAARRVYKAAGFRDADGFGFSPLKGPMYMVREL